MASHVVPTAMESTFQSSSFAGELPPVRKKKEERDAVLESPDRKSVV